MFTGLDEKTKEDAIQAMEDEMVRRNIIEVMWDYAAKIIPDIHVYDADRFEAAPLEKVVYACADEYLFNYDDREVMETLTRENYPTNPLSTQTYAFFHELGHILAAEKYEDPMAVFNEHDRELLFLTLTGPEDMLEKNRIYKQLKVEKDADYEAIKLIESDIEAAIGLDILLHQIAKGE